jgi:putative hydrolase of the HAD superfamily
MIRAIVFDFGNVVAFFDHRLTTQRLRDHGEFDPDELHAYIYGGSLEDDYEAGRISSEEFIERVREKGRLQCPPDVVTACYTDIFWPNADIAELLPRLKRRYRLLLASNTTELHSNHFRRQFAATLRHFDEIVLSHAVGARKPSPAFYEHCRARAGCRAAECVFIDDLPTNVEGARACGWHGVVYRGAADLSERLDALGVKIAGPSP